MTPRPNWATLPVTVRSVCTVTCVPSPSGVERGGDRGAGVALAARVAPFGAQHGAVARFVELLEHGLALVLRGDRSDLDLHDAAVLVALDLLELRTRHARGDALDVGEDRPGRRRWNGDTEVVGQLHRSRSSRVSMSIGSPTHGTSVTRSGRSSHQRPGRPRRQWWGAAARPRPRAGRGAVAARRTPRSRSDVQCMPRRLRHASAGTQRLVAEPDHDRVVTGSSRGVDRGLQRRRLPVGPARVAHDDRAVRDVERRPRRRRRTWRRAPPRAPRRWPTATSGRPRNGARSLCVGPSKRDPSPAARTTAATRQ